MHKLNWKAMATALLLLCTLLPAASFAGDQIHKVVIQVSSADQKTQTVALNNAVNLQKAFGMDNVEIEIVAYGPGLSLMMAKNKAAVRVRSLEAQDIKFSACGNTIKKITRKTGKKPKITEGVEVVPSGIVRIVELQEQGYAYIRP